MILKRLYDEKLAQASYLIACQETGTALVVDPLRHTSRYLAAAAEEEVTITHVTETHIHADFVSGAHDLAEAAGAKLLLSDAGSVDWEYRSGGKWNAGLLTDGSIFMVGKVRIDVMHTPGHTPEHLTFLVTDTTSADAPMGAFTGDFIFVGDVGRPDLLERAAGVAGTKEDAARDLFRSLQKFKNLPDFLQIWPGHGAGSACGKALGAMPSSTLGYERLFNWGLAENDEEEFVRRVLEGQPDPPAYFALMKPMNRDGPPPRTSMAAPRDISAIDLATLIRQSATIVDTSPAADFARQHARGTINIPYKQSFLTWAGALLPYDKDIFLIVADGDNRSREITDDLALIGLDRVGGIHTLAPLAGLAAAGITTLSTPQMDVDALIHQTPNGAVVVDVRANDEWDMGHIPGAVHIPLGSLASRVDELPKGSGIIVHCQGGNRSSIAASILELHGISVSNLAGGFGEWEKFGGEVERGNTNGGDSGGGGTPE